MVGAGQCVPIYPKFSGQLPHLLTLSLVMTNCLGRASKAHDVLDGGATVSRCDDPVAGGMLDSISPVLELGRSYGESTC